MKGQSSKQLQVKVNSINPENHQPAIIIVDSERNSDREYLEPDSPTMQVSILPLESVQLHKSKVNQRLKPQIRFIPIPSEKRSAEANKTYYKKSIKNLMFRSPKARYVSEEKMRNALEQTRIMERQRRFNKVEIEKKNQWKIDHHKLKDHQNKKFQRSEEKRMLNEEKKFKRVKQKPNELKQITDKIMLKLQQKPYLTPLSKIAENHQEYYLSNLGELNLKIPQTISQQINEQQIMEANK